MSNAGISLCCSAPPDYRIDRNPSTEHWGRFLPAGERAAARTVPFSIVRIDTAFRLEPKAGNLITDAFSPLHSSFVGFIPLRTFSSFRAAKRITKNLTRHSRSQKDSPQRQVVVRASKVR